MRVLIAHASEKSQTRLADVVTRGRRFPLDIQTVDDGPEALELLLAEDPPEVALIDWDLPGIEAPEMCRLVRDFHHHHDTWIIVLATRSHQEESREVWLAGADDCVYTPAPAKILSDRVTKGLCEMAPPIREAAAAAELAAQATADATAEVASQAAAAAALAATEAATLQAVAAEDADDDAPLEAARPPLDAVCRSDHEPPRDDDFGGLTADLKASVDPDDAGEPAELAARPVRLSARQIDPDLSGDVPRGPATLDAVLARL